MKGKTWKDMTPLDRMGTKAAIHPHSTFIYVPAVCSDIRKTFARIKFPAGIVTELRRAK